jgi:hypothetical protein
MLVVIDPEKRAPKCHPTRFMKQVAGAGLAEVSAAFDEMYSAMGRPSIPPGRLLTGSLPLALYTVCSERMFCGRLY